MTYLFVLLGIIVLLIIIGIPIFLIVWAFRSKAKTGQFPWIIALFVVILYVIGLTAIRAIALSALGITKNGYGIESLDQNVKYPVTNDSVKNASKTPTGNLLFTDDRKNFSFEYPPGYTTIKSVDPTPINGTSFNASYPHIDGESTWFIQVVTSYLSAGDDPKLLLTESKANYDINYQNVSNVEFAGETAVMYDNPGSTVTRIIEFYHGGLSYQVGFSGLKNDLVEDKQINDAYALVRSSFTFLKK